MATVADVAALVAAVTLLVMCVREGSLMLDGPAAGPDGYIWMCMDVLKCFH